MTLNNKITCNLNLSDSTVKNELTREELNRFNKLKTYSEFHEKLVALANIDEPTLENYELLNNIQYCFRFLPGLNLINNDLVLLYLITNYDCIDLTCVFSNKHSFTCKYFCKQFNSLSREELQGGL
jgi:hypothetical protein